MTHPADAIVRNPVDYAKERYDLIVVGAGIYGIMLSLEAARCGLRCLLLERDDFSYHTSSNHLRILHGGLRYLQSLDIRRFRDSVSERSWFLRHFEGLTKPIDCLLPLSGKSVYRPSVFRTALALDTLAAWDKNQQIPAENRLSHGRTCSVEEVQGLVPDLCSDFVGGALWQDGFILDPMRLQFELLRWSCGYGTKALNYCPAQNLVVEKGRVLGVEALDRTNGEQYQFQAPLVINAAGPWCRRLANSWDRDIPELFPNRILVWNMLLDRPAISSAAVAVVARETKHTYFIVPWRGKMLAGTGHRLIDQDAHRPPLESELEEMLADINSVLKGNNIAIDELQKVYWGVMPGSVDCKLGKRPVIYEHGSNDGPAGLVSVSGVKFTTARSVAEKTIKGLFPDRSRKAGKDFRPLHKGSDRWSNLTAANMDDWRRLMHEESAVSLADVILRRSESLALRDWTEQSLFGIVALISDDKETQEKEVNQTLREIKSVISSQLRKYQ